MLWLLLACTDPGPSSQTGTVPTSCAVGVDPHTIEEAAERFDGLTEPTIPCFLASLQRPLQIMAVASVTSAQPGSSWSPRFLIFTDDLVVSAVPEGDGAHLLEFGEWTVRGTRTKKGELVFPLVEGHADPYTHLLDGEGTTCGLCHPREEPDAPDDAFSSDAIEPTIGSRVSLDDAQWEADACDPTVEPERCAILRAVMGSGDVVHASWPDPFAR